MLPSITISLTFFLLDTCFNPIPKPSSLVSWSQICLLNYIDVFGTVRSYQLKDKNENLVWEGSKQDRKIFPAFLGGWVLPKIALIVLNMSYD